MLEMHFLDLCKTSASSRRPVFANPRLRRDLNLRKIDQSNWKICWSKNLWCWILKAVHLGHRLMCQYCSKEFQGSASYREHQVKVHGLPRGKKRVTKKKPKSPAKKTATKSRHKLSAKIKDTKKAAIQNTSLTYYRMENYPYHKTEWFRGSLYLNKLNMWNGFLQQKSNWKIQID